jgi:hypothetical protein
MPGRGPRGEQVGIPLGAREQDVVQQRKQHLRPAVAGCAVLFIVIVTSAPS